MHDVCLYVTFNRRQLFRASVTLSPAVFVIFRDHEPLYPALSGMLRPAAYPSQNLRPLTYKIETTSCALPMALEYTWLPRVIDCV